MDPQELAAKIKQCSSKANSIAKNIISIGQTVLELDCDPPIEANKLLDECRSLVEDYSNYLEEISMHETAMAKFRREHNLVNDSVEKDVQKYDEIVKCERKNLENRQKSAFLQEYDNIVAALKPQMNDSEIIATEASNDYIDPISKKKIQRPVRNKKCNHVYEEYSIKTLIKNNPRTRCPNVGCPNRDFIKLSDLKLDEELLTQLTLSRTQNE